MRALDRGRGSKSQKLGPKLPPPSKNFHGREIRSFTEACAWWFSVVNFGSDRKAGKLI